MTTFIDDNFSHTYLVGITRIFPGSSLIKYEFFDFEPSGLFSNKGFIFNAFSNEGIKPSVETFSNDLSVALIKLIYKYRRDTTPLPIPTTDVTNLQYDFVYKIIVNESEISEFTYDFERYVDRFNKSKSQEPKKKTDNSPDTLEKKKNILTNIKNDLNSNFITLEQLSILLPLDIKILKEFYNGDYLEKMSIEEMKELSNNIGKVIYKLKHK